MNWWWVSGATCRFSYFFCKAWMIWQAAIVYQKKRLSYQKLWNVSITCTWFTMSVHLFECVGAYILWFSFQLPEYALSLFLTPWNSHPFDCLCSACGWGKVAWTGSVLLVLEIIKYAVKGMKKSEVLRLGSGMLLWKIVLLWGFFTELFTITRCIFIFWVTVAIILLYLELWRWIS